MPVMVGLPLWMMCLTHIIDSSLDGSSFISLGFPWKFPKKVIDSSSVPSASFSPASSGISAEKPDDWETLLMHVQGTNKFSLPGKLQSRMSLLSCETGGVMFAWSKTSSSPSPSSGSSTIASSSSSPSAPESSLDRGGEGGRVRDCNCATLSASTGFFETKCR